MSDDVAPFESLLEIIETVPVMVTVYNLVTDEYVYVNNTIKQVLGYQPDFFMRKSLRFVSSFVHPEDLPAVLQQNNMAIDDVGNQMFWLDAKPIVTLEYRMKHRDGSWRWLHTDRSIFLRDVSGKITHILSASLDITDRKIVEEKYIALNNELEKRVEERTNELAASEERYQTYLSQSSEGIWRFELEKPISIKLPIKKQIQLFFDTAILAECNDAMANMYGLEKPSDIVGMRLKDLLVPTDKKNIEYLSSFIKSNYRLNEAESHEKDNEGSDRYFENNLVGVVKNGYLYRSWGTQKDITERKELERRKNDFIAIASHELRTPLTSLKLYTDIMANTKADNGSEKVGNFIQKMSYQIDRLSRLVNDLLDVTKIQEGKMALYKEIFYLDKLIHEVVSDLQVIYPTHSLKIKGHLNGKVYADKFRINQVLINLLVNAIKFSPKANEVVIMLREDKENVFVSVKDHGIGISTADQKNLSSRFFQADMRKGGGLGLGLFIVSYIVEHHGGELKIKSEKGKGSTFTFRLPRKARKTAARKLLS